MKKALFLVYDEFPKLYVDVMAESFDIFHFPFEEPELQHIQDVISLIVQGYGDLKRLNPDKDIYISVFFSKNFKTFFHVINFLNTIFPQERFYYPLIHKPVSFDSGLGSDSK